MELRQALRAGSGIRLALTGAGGKTTALFSLARQLSPPVFVTASTHLSTDQVKLADRHWTISHASQIDRLREEIDPNGVNLFTGEFAGEGRMQGLDETSLASLHRLADGYHAPLLIEADGSRQKPLKAPAEHEPVVPDWVDTVCVLAGLSGLGKPLAGENVHRAERFAQFIGNEPGELVTREDVAKVLAHPQGGLKNIPPGARKIAICNQADSEDLRQEAGWIARSILGAYDAVLIASLGLQGSPVFAVYEAVAGIILAAGASTRFGQPKVLLEWRGEPFVRRVAKAALAGGLSPVIIVIGELEEDLRAAVQGLPVEVIRNHDWERGQSSSLRAGLRVVPLSAGAAVFLLADQPQVPVSVLRQLVDLHSRTLSPVIAPQVDGHRANPALFDRQTFPDLLALEGDTGGRALMGRYPVSWLSSQDGRLLWDIDTPDDYQRLLGTDWRED